MELKKQAIYTNKPYETVVTIEVLLSKSNHLSESTRNFLREVKVKLAG